MNVVVWLCLIWVALLPAQAHSSLKLERFSIAGTDYIRLEDWAHANNLEAKWVVPKQELRLALGASSLALTVDSARMSLNGIHVWLSTPVTLRTGSACVASVDLLTSIQPLFFPARSSGKVIRRIVLDPGHGGKDPGNQEGKQQEKKYTLLLAKDVSELLNKAGFKASLTRSSDSFVELPSRAEIARRRGADLFISLHFNSAEGPGGSGVKGVEIYCLTPAHTSSTNARGEGAATGSYPGNRFDSKNILLGYQLQKAILKNVATEDRGLRRARFAVLRSAEMPAVLIEGGFMTHPTEAKKIYEPAYRRQMAQAIVDGIKAYKNLAE